MAEPAWQLETERLWLRRITLEDAGLMLAVWNDPRFIRHVGDRGIRTIEEAHDALRSGAFRLYQDYGYGPYSLTRKTDGTQVGICGLFKRDILDHPDIGFAVLPDHCGQGIAGEAAAEVVRHAREDLELAELAGIVSPGNAASISLLEKLGLRRNGTITMPGETEAVCLYHLPLQQAQ